ncbi:hypothetical protein Smp_123340 [Schistosoma mansoni]|uniref:hypothetical protein n=1 Tax=Schistosoma mansoni TaxID=6183 RepID=UPI00022DC608|nr:hypothetical protein Smp_123340 [Schistosoma mansoni]|eukprot:XP_018649909.1 hypothetical protein Smp_123340 [Schistosoma mansoni]
MLFSDLCEWVEFFEAAGVPAKLRETYAGIFVEHRINNSVLADLDKDHLKDMGITLSVAPTPVVTSTTSKDCSSENKKAVSKNVAVLVPVRRRMNPEVEGKYIVKMPKGTTLKTQKIFASMKQKNSAKSSQPEVAKAAKTNEPPVSSTFEDSDADDCDNYRVIISKSNTHGSTSSDSVFSRLGNAVNREDSPTSVLIKKTIDPSAAMQRFIRWNLNDNSLGSPFRPPPSVTETMMTSSEDSLNFKVVKQVSSLTKNVDQPIKLRTPLKRHASDTVFSRLSTPSTTIQSNDQLSYQGILKKSRTQPPKFNDESMSPCSLNSFLSPYTEGVLGQSRMQKVSVKNRLGNRQGKSNAPVHSRLGRASNPL